MGRKPHQPYPRPSAHSPQGGPYPQASTTCEVKQNRERRKQPDNLTPEAIIRGNSTRDSWSGTIYQNLKDMARPTRESGRKGKESNDGRAFRKHLLYQTQINPTNRPSIKLEQVAAVSTTNPVQLTTLHPPTLPTTSSFPFLYCQVVHILSSESVLFYRYPNPSFPSPRKAQFSILKSPI